MNEAANGPKALEVLRASDDVAFRFTDVAMPGGMNGRELAERARTERLGLKVLYISGYTRDAIVHQGRLDPDVQLLGKPWRRQDLIENIRAALDA